MIYASLKVRPFRCCLMDVNNANTLSLMRHCVKPQNVSMGHVFQRLLFSGFMSIHKQCFGAKHTFVQKGDYCDMRSSVIVSITWHLVTVCICHKVNTTACSNVTFVLWILLPAISLNPELGCAHMCICIHMCIYMHMYMDAYVRLSYCLTC